MKKIFFTIFLLLIFASLVPNLADAGLVPCGGIDDNGIKQPVCQLCHFFVLFSNIMEFALFKLVPPLAALIITFGGIKFMIAGESKDKVEEAKKLIRAVLLGLIIIFGAWLFLNTFFSAIGVQEWTGLQSGWWTIDCPVE